MYAPELVATVLSSLPCTVLCSEGGGDWYRWQALWDLPGGPVEVNFTLYDIEPVAWGGSGLKGSADTRALLDALLWVRARLPGVWLHDGECNLYTPETFAHAFVR